MAPKFSKKPKTVTVLGISSASKKLGRRKRKVAQCKPMLGICTRRTCLKKKSAMAGPFSTCKDGQLALPQGYKVRLNDEATYEYACGDVPIIVVHPASDDEEAMMMGVSKDEDEDEDMTNAQIESQLMDTMKTASALDEKNNGLIMPKCTRK